MRCTEAKAPKSTVISADLAHLVERDLAKVEVAGSSPVIRSNIKQKHHLMHNIIIRRYSQVVRPRSAKPLFPGSNPGGASKNKSTSYEVLLFLERCLPLRARDVAFGSDVHCVSDVSPYGEVGKHHITLRRRSNTSLWQSHIITAATPQHHYLQTIKFMLY